MATSNSAKFLGEYIDILVDGETYVLTGAAAINVKYNDGTPDAYLSKIVVDKTRMASISPYIAYGVSGEAVDEIVYPMFNRGDTALPWEPYRTPQTLPVQTPNGLPGIPVSSGGNYTDANGQQWICDEVDFKRGVYVQRVKRARLMGNVNDGEISQGRYSINVRNIFGAIATSRHYIITSNARTISPSSQSIQGQIFQYNDSVYWYCTDWFASKEDLETFLDENNVTIIGHLATPIETPLSASELAAYAALRTYSPTTVVSNDAGAWMKVGYYSYGAIERLVRWAESAERK